LNVTGSTLRKDFVVKILVLNSSSSLVKYKLIDMRDIKVLAIPTNEASAVPGSADGSRSWALRG